MVMGGDQTLALDQVKPLNGVWTVKSRTYSQEHGRVIVEQVEGDAFLRVRDDSSSRPNGSTGRATRLLTAVPISRRARRSPRLSQVRCDRLWKIRSDDHVFSHRFFATSPPMVRPAR